MKEQLKKKLLAYSSLGSAITMIAAPGEAQIIYFDPPDIVINSGSYDLDLDNNGVYDFRFFNHEDTSGHIIGFTAADDYRSIMSGSNCNFYLHVPRIIPAGQVIKKNNNWTNISYSSVGFFCYEFYDCGGPKWTGKEEKFFAFRFRDVPGQINYHYGWMRVSVSGDCHTLKIHDWAYNSVPGSLITAGQTMRLNGDNDSTGETSLENLSIFSYHDQLYIKNNAEGLLLRICLLDLNGRKLKTLNSSDAETQVDLAAWPDGMYIVQLSTETASVSKKIVKD